MEPRDIIRHLSRAKDARLNGARPSFYNISTYASNIHIPCRFVPIKSRASSKFEHTSHFFPLPFCERIFLVLVSLNANAFFFNLFVLLFRKV